MKDLSLNLIHPDYEAPDAFQFYVEPVKCFATSDPKPYTGEGWGDDFGDGTENYED